MTWNFVVFFSIVIVLYLAVNFYMFIRGLQALPSDTPLKFYYIITFGVLSLSFWAGRILENYHPSYFSDILVWVGSFWLAFILYMILSIFLIDILRLINHFVHIFPNFITNDIVKTKIYLFYGTILIVVSTLIGGYINFSNPRIKQLDLTINKTTEDIKSLNIIMASDIHMGTIVSNGRVMKLVDMINGLNPDIVLLPGDIFDEDLGPVIRRNLGENLRKIKAKYGIYAVNGNHEFIGGVAAADKYLTEHGIVLLRDSVVVIKNQIVIVGREDRSGNRIKPRKSLSQLLEGFDTNKPIIMMDHQPFQLYEAELAGIDLQLSGHTHHGQLWPINYITQKVYEVSWGYKKKGNTHIYVSSGASGWGPPVRTGSRTEIVNIKLNFK
ncbi:MAG: metallophosphoesterase [bacterium]